MKANLVVWSIVEGIIMNHDGTGMPTFYKMKGQQSWAEPVGRLESQ